jgi:hypothetical protein
MKYKESEDVIIGNGDGTMEIDDETLPMEKDVVELPVSSCDEVDVLITAPAARISRIAFNKYNNDTDAYDSSKSIDPRIVYVRQLGNTKTFGIRDTPGTPHVNWTNIVSPMVASSLEVSFSYLVTNYAYLSRLLTKANLRRAKFNLPVYEVDGLKHYIPIYLSQYKAYFYDNKINNFVPGQLCITELIKL